MRKLLGYVRYDSAPALAAINTVYEDLRLFQNLFLPSVKLVEKRRVGARLQRRYDAPRTPLERVEACAEADPAKVRTLRELRARLDPFVLAQRIDQQLAEVYRLANQRVSPAAPTKIPRVDAARPVDAQHASTRSLQKPHRTRFRTATTHLCCSTISGNRNSGATMCRSVTVTYGLTGRRARARAQIHARVDGRLE